MKKTMYGEVLSRAEYEWTKAALKLTAMIRQLQKWVKEHMKLMGIDKTISFRFLFLKIILNFLGFKLH